MFTDFPLFVFASSLLKLFTPTELNWLEIVKEWQTLIVGISAGLPTAISAYFLWRQVRTQQNEIQRSRQQQEIAARIALPMALSLFSSHWKKCFSNWAEGELDQIEVDFPKDALTVIMNAAPVSDQKTFECVLWFVRKCQNFQARVGKSNRSRIPNVDAVIVRDLAELDFVTDLLYAYGRLDKNNLQLPNFSDDLLVKQIKNNIDCKFYCKENARVISRLTSVFGSFSID